MPPEVALGEYEFPIDGVGRAMAPGEGAPAGDDDPLVADWCEGGGASPVLPPGPPDPPGAVGGESDADGPRPDEPERDSSPLSRAAARAEAPEPTSDDSTDEESARFFFFRTGLGASFAES